VKMKLIADRVRAPIAVLVVRFDDLTWGPNLQRDPREAIVAPRSGAPLYRTPLSLYRHT
jgi:hypothetical protein